MGGRASVVERRTRGRDRPWKIVTVVAGAALIGFVAFVVVSSQGKPSPASTTFPATVPTSLARGSVAPGFSLPRLGGGPQVTLASTRGRPTIVSFFASWCSHCRSELRAVAAVAATDGGRISVIGVDTSDPDTTEVEHLLARAGGTYPVAKDSEGHVAAEYRLTGLPATYFLDARGQVAGVAFGAQTASSLDAWVRRLTAGNAS